MRLPNVKHVLFAAFALALALPLPAAADGIVVGSAEEAGSWSLNIGCGLCGPFDTMEWFIIADTGAGPFEPPGSSNFSDPSWSGGVINQNYTLASGNDVNTLVWRQHFAGNIANSVSIDFLLWDGGVFGDLTFAAAFDLTNGQLRNLRQAFNPPYPFLQHPDGRGYNRQAPEPASMALFGIALGAAGLARRNRRRS